MNSKIVIPIIIGIIIVIVGIIAITNQETTEEGAEVQWRKSGPFSIEKYEYYLGEKIFLNVNYIPKEMSGEIIFFRPGDNQMNKNIDELKEISEELITEKVKYLGIKFDGEKKQNFNRYFEPRLNEWAGVCSTNDLIGEWVVVFSGTSYEPIYFTILDQKMPGDTREMEPIVGVGKC